MTDKDTSGDTALETTPDNAAETRLEQSVTVEAIGPAFKRLTIEIPESRIKDKIEEGFQSLRQEAVLPGFRRGRAPQRLVQKRFGESIRDDVRGQLISESYAQAIEDESLQVLGEPELKDAEDIKLPESGPLVVIFEMEVAPDIELPDFAKLNITRESVEITDEDVEAEIERIREQMGQMTVVDTADTAVSTGDFVNAALRILPGLDADDSAEAIIDLPSTYAMVNGEEREYKGHVAGIMVDDLGRQLEGRKAGDTVRISMTGPENHENDQICQQPITLVMTINAIHRLEPASMDRIKEVFQVESEDGVRGRIRETLEARREREQTTAMHEQAVEQLRAMIPMELPEKITGRQTERLIARRRTEMQYQGMSEQDIESQLAELRAGSREEAINEMKNYFILNKAADELKIEVSEQELNSRIAMQAMQSGRRPEKVRQEMLQNGQMESLYLSLREHKTLDEIVKQANVTETEAQATDPEPKKKKKKTTKTTKATKAS